MKRILCVLALLAPWMVRGHVDHGPDSMEGAIIVTNFVPFVDPLPIPPILAPSGTTNGLPLYSVTMSAFQHQFHRDFPPVEVWGYNGMYPGPTIQATNDQPIWVHWINNLPTEYPEWLKPDPNNHGVSGNLVQNVVHLHGAASRPEYDGHPTNWFRPGESQLYLYENIDFTSDGETLWYHDHAIGVTANNVYAGLAGFYLLRHPTVESRFNLPSGQYEIPLVFQDRDIQTNLMSASLVSDGLPWRFLPVVNGKIAPYLEVEPRTYRFRFLNGCVYRTLGLTLFAGSTNVPMFMIGTENGFVPKTVRIGNPGDVGTLRMMPGERADLIIDFSEWRGSEIVLTNFFSPGNFGLPPSVSPELNSPTNVVGGVFMKFIVKDMEPSYENPVPEILDIFHESAEDLARQAVRTRTITLDLRDELQLVTTNLPAPVFERDPHVFALLNLMHFSDPVTETPRLGDVEIWEFVNLTSEAHPMHVHLLDFMVLNRSRFRGFTFSRTNIPSAVLEYIADRTNNTLRELDYYMDPDNVPPGAAYESGPKDTVHAAPWAVTRIVMRWPSDPRFVGPYVYHCHILDHEDNDMMRPLQVLPALELANLAPGEFAISRDPEQRELVIQMGTEPGYSYLFESSSDLVNWSGFTNIVGHGGTVYFVQPESTATGTRFYRARVPGF